MNYKRKRTPANPNPRSSMQAFHFLRSLSLINLRTATFHKRCRAIRRAAYASMASSTKPDRAWRHAVLSRLRRKARPVRVRVKARRRKAHHDDALRRILPGGEAMDSSRLLEETIDYVQRLRAQVKLMQEIVDSVKKKESEE
ncbi:transcription factor IBH1 [Phalaenopsis equestris]|uniref:transcription factor IBH1 n=1 Tax=Phalaenopsis equestris TaxID=78828 RepID=UPI0009E51891|nr:transcription factor IBH1 [Phalaenopsis equestris]